MIYFDVTKSSAARHHSGLTRVARRLQEALGDAVRPVVWSKWDRQVRAEDWFLTPELFSEAERPGLGAFLEERRCRTAAVFHDAIPLQLPHVTWPQSVARHPIYLSLLSRFDRVFAVSAASRDVLLGFWRWQRADVRAHVQVLALGSDFNGEERGVGQVTPPAPRLLSIGILEPRKNQTFLLEVVRSLWDDGLKFELHLVGRVNPHFGRAVYRDLRATMKKYADLFYYGAASDEQVRKLYARSRALVFPTVAEGCGLPVLEALWRGLPVVCSDLPVLLENAESGGCLPLPVNDLLAWREGLRSILTDPTRWSELATQARVRTLPTWQECAVTLQRALARR